MKKGYTKSKKGFIDNDPQKAGQKICLENTQDSTGGGGYKYISLF